MEEDEFAFTTMETISPGELLRVRKNFHALNEKFQKHLIEFALIEQMTKDNRIDIEAHDKAIRYLEKYFYIAVGAISVVQVVIEILVHSIWLHK